MRCVSFFIKSVRENLRDWKILIMTLCIAPIYVLITYVAFGSTSQTYTILLNNLDKPVISSKGPAINYGNELEALFRKASFDEKSRIFRIKTETSAEAAEKSLKDRTSDAYVVIPASFSKMLRDNMTDPQKPKAKLIIYGDENNPKYSMARMFIDTLAYTSIMSAAGVDIPLDIEGRPVKNSKAPSPFGAYIPGLLALSLTSLIFTGAATIIKEVDRGSIKRLKISRLTPTEFLTAISATQAIISIPVVLLTFFTSCALGYRPVGPVGAILAVGFFSSFSIMGISLLIASFINSIFELMTVGSLPYFVLLFLSGAWFPMPGKDLLHIGSHSLGITDLLPISQTVSAMNKILNFGSGIDDIWFELAVILILTMIYFSAGVALFKRKHMRLV